MIRAIFLCKICAVFLTIGKMSKIACNPPRVFLFLFHLSFSFAHRYHQRIAFDERNVDAHTTEQQYADCHGSREKSVV